MSDTSTTRFCIDCGTALPDDGEFCMECGLKVGELPAVMPTAPANPFGCPTCGGEGAQLPEAQLYCPQCRWLRPLHADYHLPEDAFMWQMDAQAMRVLNSTGPLASAAHGIAQRYGRPVFEAATNGVRLSDRQLPELFDLALRAARLMGLPHMPEVYVSGERMWDVYSLGGYGGSFISIGSVLINLKPDDLLFLIAREMGHVRAGHVYWKTAMQFLMGQTSSQSTILGEGVLQFLNPAKLLESAVEAPLMRWSRHAEITADRAAVLVTGRLDQARQVLTQWAMKSFPIYGKLNQEAWLEQEAAADDPYLRMSEWTMATTPYLAPRLRTLAEFVDSDAFREWRRYIEYYAPTPALQEKAEKKPAELPADKQRLTCAACGGSMIVPKSLLDTDKPVNVRCPNADCRKVLRVKPKASAPGPDPAPAASRPDRVRITCVACKEPMYVDKAALAGDAPVNVRCPNAACGEVLSVKPRKRAKKPEPSPDQLSD
ncbi:MAG: M48 family metalloprotease [Pseudomonadales bacterium]